ncbi:phytoene/squalene synthase family protein [Methanobacterium sp. ACI-7]|uniref:phytoene/squalene synthase family protein n=1 Tax=unclassified Methanobacterium TaxID=2627676 RepID=UPI0039C19927
MIDQTIYSIFKGGSKTYFYSTIFFPKRVKEDVFILYSFLRKADDYVDAIPQDTEGFYGFKERYYRAIDGDITGDIVVDSFVKLVERNKFETGWADAFLNSMEMDITVSKYKTMEDLLVYLYGSSEVVGLFMAKIMDLSPESYENARYLGRAMQYINFIRDIAEDIDLGRTYFPQKDIKHFNIESLNEEYTCKRPEEFNAFVRKQLETYYSWQEKAENGFSYMPFRYLIPIKTASDLYKWTGSQINKNPFVVYERKVKPSIPNILSKVLFNSITAGLG